MIRNIFKHINLALICFALLTGVAMISLVSCEDDENGGAVELYSFGPSPVLRGESIMFIGQNLNKITSVTIPDNIEITDVIVTNNSRISIVVPQEAQPGFITLNYNGGSIVTKTRLGFTEPYSISSISPTESAVREGDEVTISGDYLNNIVKVIFQPGATVDSANFVSQSRQEIKLLVPKEAASGKIIIEDEAGNQLYSEDEFTISLPEITSASPLTIKAGNDLTINGTNLDLVSSIKFQGGSTVDAVDFVSQTATAIIVTTPDNLQDGTFSLISYSGEEIVSSDDLTTVVPTGLSIVAETRFKTGLNVEITGTNLDLVTSVVFTGGSAITDFTYADNKITVAIPDNAIDGVVTLNTAAEKSVETTAITLVVPTVTDASPNPVTAGSDLVITGTDFDLVTSVTFGGGVDVEVTPDSETSITVTVPVDAETGAIALNLINGESVNTPSVTIDSPVFCFIPVLPGDDVEINAGSLFMFEVENGDVLTDVKVGGNSTQFIIQGSSLHVLIPENANGTTDLNLISSNGGIIYQINIIGSGIVETVIWEGPVDMTWSDGGRAMIPVSGFDGVPAGAKLKIYFVQHEAWGQVQINNGAWAVIPFEELNNDGYLKPELYNDKTVTEQELVLTQAILDNINNNADGEGNGIIMQGSDWTIVKVSVIVETTGAETLWEGTEDMGNWASWVQLSSDSFTNAAEGKKIAVTFELDGSASAWQVALKNGSDWSDIEIVDVSSDATSHEFTIDSNILSIAQASGLIFSGANYTLKKIELK